MLELEVSGSPLRITQRPTHFHDNGPDQLCSLFPFSLPALIFLSWCSIFAFPYSLSPILDSLSPSSSYPIYLDSSWTDPSSTRGKRTFLAGAVGLSSRNRFPKM